MEFHDDYPQYELMAHHGEEEGKKARRTLWNVFWIMLAITVVELIIGAMAPGKGWTGATWLKVFFIVLTIAKAAAIVWWKHYGDRPSSQILLEMLDKMMLKKKPKKKAKAKPKK